MSRLEDICYHLYEASSERPATLVRAEWAGKPFHPDQAKADIKALMLEIAAEVTKNQPLTYQRLKAKIDAL